MWRYLLFRVAAWIVPHVGEKAGYWAFARLADIIYLGAWRTRAFVQRNLTQALGAEATTSKVRRLARRVFWNLLWNYYEMFHMPALGEAELQARVRVVGVEHAEEIAGRGTGAVWVFPHIGNLEILMQIPRLYSQYRFIMLVEHMQDDHLHKLMNGLRASRGLQVVAVSEIRKIVGLLREGWNVALAGDFDSTRSGVVVDFLGAPARMPDGAVRLALRMGVPLVLAYGWRVTDRSSGGKGISARHCLWVTRPVELPRTGDPAEDVRRGVEEVVGRLAPLIRAHLDQWLAFHPVWEKVEQ